MNGQVLIASLRPETLSWEQALRMFRLRGRAGGHSERTIDNYSRSLAQAVKFFRELGGERPSAVTPIHVKQFLEEFRKKGLSSATIATHYGILKTFFRSLASDGLLTSPGFLCQIYLR